MSNKLKITLVKSPHGRLSDHKMCIRGIGLKKINDTVEIDDTPSNRGMINKINYLLKVAKVD